MFANNWEEIPQYFTTSATDGMGKEDLLSYIAEINEDLFKNDLL
jgi:GTP-binding protein